MNYWLEALSCALDEEGLFHVLNSEQLERVAEHLDRSADMKSEATGSLFIPNPLKRENEELTKKLETERGKVHCEACGGHGTIITNFGIRSSESRCSKCNGEGRHLP